MTIPMHADPDRNDLTHQIDELVETGGANPSAGFDTANTPLGMFPVAADGYLFGTPNRGFFTLGDIADRYIWSVAGRI